MRLSSPPRRIERNAESVRFAWLKLGRQRLRLDFVAVQFYANVFPPVGPLLGKGDVDKTQVAAAGIYERVLGGDFERRLRPSDETNPARFFADKIARRCWDDAPGGK